MTEALDVLIVGAGFAGLAALAQLRDRGFSVRAVERGDDVGGTWYWNHYPGLRCDVESVHYSYSWDPRLEQDWTWSERYSTQPEILRYAQHVADRFELRPLITFGVEVLGVTFDEQSASWTARLSNEDTLVARWVILATGALSTPKPLDISGAERFAGETFHTASWPVDPVDFRGRRVAVIGTGSSGIQVATEIARDAQELLVLQRTPSYSIPAANRPLGAEESAKVKAGYRELRASARASIDGLSLPTTGRRSDEFTEAEQRAVLEEAYAAGVPFTLYGIFDDVMFEDEGNRIVADFVGEKIRERVHDPAVAEKLTPRGYPFGTKRACLDSGYYEIFNQPNVRLVDLHEHPIVQIVPEGIETTADVLAVDTIVYATGYDAFTGTATRMDIRGTTGTLAEAWAGGAHAYLGLMVPTFPNLFLVTGPQSPSVLSNMFVSIEQHVEFIVGALVAAREQGVVRFEATPEAEQEWIGHAAELAEILVYRHATSWYVGGNIAGKPRVVLPYLGGVGAFRQKCESVAAEGYTGFTLAGATRG